MTVYADSSFVVPLYVQEGHSDRAFSFASSAVLPIFIGSLVELETTNAIQLRLFRKQASPPQARAALRNLRTDLLSGFFLLEPAPETVWSIARDLALSHTPVLGSRSLDILQVATAVALKVESFLTFDRNQSALARAAGLNTPIELI